ncbi:transposase [Salmonella enterica subsp. enterica]|nr:transposase [Salmonella enterica subsp. enterica]
MTKDIVLNALLMAVWRRHPQKQVLVQSDQGSQYTRYEWLKSHGLEVSMSRRGNCHNAVAESFFQLLKRERIKEKDLPTTQKCPGYPWRFSPNKGYLKI